MTAIDGQHYHDVSTDEYILKGYIICVNRISYGEHTFYAGQIFRASATSYVSEI